MNKYELMFIISTGTTEDEKQAIIEKVKGLVSVDGGVVANVDKWGTRKLAYPIQFKNEGFYVLINFEAKPETIATATQQINLIESVIRFMFVKK